MNHYLIVFANAEYRRLFMQNIAFGRREQDRWYPFDDQCWHLLIDSGDMSRRLMGLEFRSHQAIGYVRSETIDMIKSRLVR